MDTGQKKMYKGDWECSVCRGMISELPFEPRSTSNLVCSSCFKEGKRAPGGGGGGKGDRKMFEGNWKCGTCSKPISKLPFEPTRTDNLKCLDCFKASKG